MAPSARSYGARSIYLSQPIKPRGRFFSGVSALEFLLKSAGVAHCRAGLSNRTSDGTIEGDMGSPTGAHYRSRSPAVLDRPSAAEPLRFFQRPAANRRTATASGHKVTISAKNTPFLHLLPSITAVNRAGSDIAHTPFSPCGYEAPLRKRPLERNPLLALYLLDYKSVHQSTSAP